MKRTLNIFCQILLAMAKHPRLFAKAMAAVPSMGAAYAFSRAYRDSVPEASSSVSESKNPLMEYFQNHQKGPGLWKWEHYFEIYHRHLSKFVGRKVDVLEIGIYSGGSLEMWRNYFGEKCHIYGVDIQGACKTYENDHVSVFIGDQADKAFWSTFRKSVPGIDVLIDDGGHTPEQQQITLEEMLRHLRPGGVYICEDVHGVFNRFAAYATGLVSELNSIAFAPGSVYQSKATQYQSAIHSIHFYPYLVVIEKRLVSLPVLSAPKHGTEWQPFL